VGFTEVVPVGAEVREDTPLAVVHAGSAADAEEAARLFREACGISDAKPEERPVVYERLTGD
jgi:thymidine phosphorylase